MSLGSEKIYSDPGKSDPSNTWPDFNAIPTDQYGSLRDQLRDAYLAVRNHTFEISNRFSEAEQQIQSMPDASPTKWHLAHTTWFFETFILSRHQPGFTWFNERYCYLFNSYYNAVGAQYPRHRRGLITNPDLAGVKEYRRAVDAQMRVLLEEADSREFDAFAHLLLLGLNHEQQHQELIATDITHALYQAAGDPETTLAAIPGQSSVDQRHGETWQEHEGGRARIGYGGEGFCFDNELARHDVLVNPFRISDGLVTAGQWLAFMEDYGYNRPLLWLSDGWQWKNEQGIEAPLYWRKAADGWFEFSMDGWKPVDPMAPVSHISYYEADAFAQWRGARLPRESEWECSVDGFTDAWQCWEWTQSAYSAYPGFRPWRGDAGEYNGKFMVNQMVLRGGSCFTPAHHTRPSYRNFFPPSARWQRSGLRLAREMA